MSHTFISITLGFLALCSIAAQVLALRRLRKAEPAPIEDRIQWSLLITIVIGTAGLFLYRYFSLGRWQPLSSHLDGLLLISTLLACAIAFTQTRARLFGLSAFALPLLTLMLAWGVCAAAWTYRAFDLDSLHPVWMGFHLTCVYLGTFCATIAAIVSGMYLYIQRRLKQKRDLSALGKLASLERLEMLIIRTAMLGFVMLSLALTTGAIILLEQPGGTSIAQWYQPKIILATLAWAIYALVMNVRHATHFRGPRAAWLSIAGFVLLLLAYSLVTAMPDATTLLPGGSH